MNDDILKGNFKVEKKVEDIKDEKESLAEEVKKRTLVALSGSMVYVERNKLEWDGDE